MWFMRSSWPMGILTMCCRQLMRRLGDRLILPMWYHMWLMKLTRPEVKFNLALRIMTSNRPMRNVSLPMFTRTMREMRFYLHMCHMRLMTFTRPMEKFDFTDVPYATTDVYTTYVEHALHDLIPNDNRIRLYRCW